MIIAAPQWSGDQEKFVDDLLAWLCRAGASNYDEQVTQLEHALQTAERVAQAQDAEAAMVAALLHDVGHFLVDEHQGQGAFLGQDLQHEAVGAQWLTQCFPVEVTEPVRLHVLAKRWLCTVDEVYWQGLSEASKRSFLVQGGRMSAAEMTAFQAHDYWQHAVTLRRHDDLGKQRGRRVPDIAIWRQTVLHVLTA